MHLIVVLFYIKMILSNAYVKFRNILICVFLNFALIIMCQYINLKITYDTRFFTNKN